MSREGSGGWGLPDFARVGIAGVLCFLVLYLIGAVPGLPSPINEIKAAIAETKNVLQDHDRNGAEQTRVLRNICRGIWRGDPDQAKACGSPIEK